MEDGKEHETPGASDETARDEGRLPVPEPVVPVLPRSVNIDLIQHIITVYSMFNECPALDRRAAGYCTIAYFICGGNLPEKVKRGEVIEVAGTAEKVEQFRNLIIRASHEIFEVEEERDEAEDA